MIRLVVLLLAWPLAAGAAECRVAGLPKLQGLDYHSARAKLIRAGFLPVAQPRDEARDAPGGCYLFDLPTPLYGYIEAMPPGNQTCSFRWIGPDARHFTVSFSHIRQTRMVIECAE